MPLDVTAVIVVDTGTELLLFRNALAAERYIEAVDVENSEYAAAYGSDGGLWRLSVEREDTSHLFGLLRGTSERVRLNWEAGSPTRENELAVRLRSFLAGTEPSPLASEMELSALLCELHRRVGFTG